MMPAQRYISVGRNPRPAPGTPSSLPALDELKSRWLWAALTAAVAMPREAGVKLPRASRFRLLSPALAGGLWFVATRQHADRCAQNFGRMHSPDNARGPR